MPTVPEIRRRVASLPGARLGTDAVSAAAVVLLASAWTDKNIDRLCGLTRLPRETVARCARRLVDNGVWQNGAVVCSWAPEAGDLGDAEAFWADVAVAEGKLSRRMSEEGLLEWAPTGSWWKGFEQAPGEPTSDGHPDEPSFLSGTAGESTGALAESERPADEDETDPPAGPAKGGGMNTARGPRSALAASKRPSLPGASRRDSEASAELFPGASWMR